MIPVGTTPTHEFAVTEDFTGATKCYITYQQFGKTVLEKDIDDVTITATKITTTLTQEETLKFDESAEVEMQIRIKMPDGSAHKSEVIKTTTDELLKEGAI